MISCFFMMNYTNYSVEEFIQDAYFRQWAFDELSSDDTFWETWIQLNPEKIKGSRTNFIK